MQKVVGIKFNSSSKVYLFSPNNLDLHIGDNVIVDSKLGLSYGKVVSQIKQVEEHELSEPLKNVVRIATSADTKKFIELEKKAENDIKFVKQQVEKNNLEMKIVSAQYTFDGTKIIIEFSADDRVDFRELLKDLASELKVRIELHQVGQRDEVKIKGGLGPCGEICCCARFLKEFEHVTVKMAKNQGLSLSPTKISGLCGRLMCCLAYENSNYEAILKKMPKVNSEIDSPKGRGTVVYNDILRERVSVKVRSLDDSFIVYDFALEELFPEMASKKENVLEDLKKVQENKEPKKEPVNKENNKNNNKPKQEIQKESKSEENKNKPPKKKNRFFNRKNKQSKNKNNSNKGDK